MAGPNALGLSGQESEFEDFLLLNSEGQKRLQEKYAAAAVEAKVEIDWKGIHYDRIALMSLLAGQIGGNCRYLEIGCDRNKLFDAMPMRHKAGVDPVRGGTHRMTSDEFFARSKKKFDLIFIDGLHTYEQLHRDVENALKVLAPGGFIAMHDLVPLNWREAHVPRVNMAWTGDVWKVGVELAQSPDIIFKLFMIDHGVGVIHCPPDREPGMIRDMSDTLGTATFADFLTLLEDMPTVDWSKGAAWIRSVDAKSARGRHLARVIALENDNTSLRATVAALRKKLEAARAATTGQ